MLKLDSAWGISLSGNFQKSFAQLEKNISKDELREIKVGYSLFAKPWVFAGSSTKRRDGLGPHFSATSCISCHPAFGRGAPPGILHKNDPALIFLTTNQNLKDQYNNEINTQSHPSIPSEGRPKLITVTYKIQPLFYGINHKALEVSPRIAPHLAGAGYIELIDETDIIANQNNGGTVHLVNKKVGRFGWKASQPDLATQIATAFLQDMGITSYLKPFENCPLSDLSCLDLENGSDEEGTEIRIDHFNMVVKLLQSILPPKSKPYSGKGEKIFNQVGCNTCHRKEYQTAKGKIQPYSDFLLHDMGANLADYSSDSMAKLWKTPPLWGLGSQQQTNGHTRLLHDGRAANVEEAILWHDGESRSVRIAYELLEDHEKEDLLDFLNSL